MKIDELNKHVLDICQQVEIHIIWIKKPLRAKAYGEFDEIKIAPIKSHISYAVALHEIGHFLGRHQSSKTILGRERWAWRWAMSHTLIWTPRMDRCMCDSLAWCEMKNRSGL